MHRGFITAKTRRASHASHIVNAVDSVIEQLEERQLLTVTTLPNQWSTFTDNLADGGRKVYVSNSVGSNSNDGLTPDTPKKTLGAAKSLMRDGKPDWLLLKRGDTWNEAIGSWFGKSGISHDKPMVISYYGFYDDFLFGPTYYDFSTFPANPQFLGLEARPIINSGSDDGLKFEGGSSHVDVVGLEFFANTYNGSNSHTASGIRAQLNGTDYLVEDVKIRGYRDNVTIAANGAVVDGFIFRRSQSLDAYSYVEHAQGLYASGATKNLVIEENTFDHNGWKVDTDKTVFNHDMYINTGAENVTVQRNVITRGSLRGTLLRSGGKVLDNLYAQNPVAIQVGNTASQVEGNVILQGVDLPSLASGVGIDVSFSMPSVTVKNNIIAHDSSAYTYNLSGINLNSGTNNATVTGNIVYDWRRTFVNGVSGGSNIVQNNAFQDFDNYHSIVNESSGGSTTYGNNKYYSGTTSKAFQDGGTREDFDDWKSDHPSDNSSEFKIVSYIDPNRDLATYNRLLKGSNAASFSEWIKNQRAQSRETWDNAYTAGAAITYIKAGFSTSAGEPPIPAQVINVTAPDAGASELGLETGVFRLTRTGTAVQLLLPMQVNIELGGSATANADYTINPSFIEFPSFNGTSQFIDVVVTPKTDTLIEGDETVKFKILAKGNPANPDYVTGSSPVATVNITDATVAVNVQATQPTALEVGPVTGTFTFSRSGPTTSPLTVNVEITGSATNPLAELLPDNPADYNFTSGITTAPTIDPVRGLVVIGTVVFPIGASTVEVVVTPVPDTILEGGTPEDPAPGDESVGLAILPAIDASYQAGVSNGAVVTIFDDNSPPPPPPGDGGGGGTEPAPTGRGMYQRYVNAQDSFLPPPGYNGAPAPGYLTGDIVFAQADQRPGFNFAHETNHSEVTEDHFSVLWTGQIVPQFGETYTLALPLDGDASAKLYVRDDTGVWHLIAQTNDTDPTKTTYFDAGGDPTADYFTHRIGDANDDSFVNTLDFTQLSAHFGETTNTWSSGDFNADGKINALDFNAIAANYGMTDPRPTSHEISGTVNFFEPGERYAVAIQYSDKANNAKIRFLWSSPSRFKQEVPLDRLYAVKVATGAMEPLPSSGLNAASLFADIPIDLGGGSDVLG